jgi:hypothetical protein
MGNGEVQHCYRRSQEASDLSQNSEQRTAFLFFVLLLFVVLYGKWKMEQEQTANKYQSTHFCFGPGRGHFVGRFVGCCKGEGSVAFVLVQAQR